MKVVQDVDASKATASHHIPTRICKENIDRITNIFNLGTVESNFPSKFKLANITPVHKKGDKTDKSNYRPISLLSAISKHFEKLYAIQISTFMENYFSKYLCGFRKGLSTQYCLLRMIERIKKALDNKECRGLLLPDLLNAFECVKHDLLIAKMNAYNFDNNAIALVHFYLSDRKQRTNINSSFSPWHDIIIGVSTGSILGP